MPTVTQTIPNFLGGVSQQTDDLKFTGQLRSCLNAYPEPTFGLIKRPGSKFIAELKKTGGALVAPGELDGGQWFFIFRDSVERYACVIAKGALSIWSLNDGSRKTVSYDGAAQAYLGSGNDRFDVLTINDYSFITNRSTVVKALAAVAFNDKRNATVRLNSVDYGSDYTVTINGVDYTYTTFDAEEVITAPSQKKKKVTAGVILNGLKTTIDAAANITCIRVNNTLEITSTVDLSISADGGIDGDGISVYTNEVDNISKLPARTVHGRIVRITNSANTEDDYYVKFIANNGVKGIGIWEETVKPGISTGLDRATMPHQLIRNANGTFTLKQAPWEDRLVGDDETNTHPSFVGFKIQKMFFFQNRFGILSDENVAMSQAGDYFNFYHNSALTLTAADPVDISCSSVRPATLHGIVPVAQGLVLFSRSQQFLLSGAQGVISPTTTTIAVVSNYEFDITNDPVDMGTTIAFVATTPAYTRVFEMETKGQQDNPMVLDISRVVPEWIPSNIDQVNSSAQNSLLSLASSSSRVVHLFRYYFNGEERELQPWFQWELSGKVLHNEIDSDVMYVVTQQQDSYVLQQMSLIQSPTEATFTTDELRKVDPRLDMWSLPKSVAYDNTDISKPFTKVYLPFKPQSNLKLVVVTTNKNQNTDNSGLVLYPDIVQDGAEYYAKLPYRDFSKESMILGYNYSMSIELPHMYYRTGDNNSSDYTASLTIARMIFSIGLSGDVVFEVKHKGSPDWLRNSSVRDANYYRANDIPFVSSNTLTLPIHQRAENVEVRIISDTPFPVSLISMKWEGIYSPKNYTRR